MRFWIPGFVVAVAALSGAALADVVVLSPAADTTLFAAAADSSLGASDSMAVGGTAHSQLGRALIRFDVAHSLPAGAVVTGVRLEFTVVREPAGAVASMFAVHRMLRSWQEGLGIGNLGSLAATGDSTWNRRSHPDVSWTSPGGAPGSDYVGVASGEILVTHLRKYSVSSELMAGDVRAWQSDPSTEFGWMLRNEMEAEGLTARRVASREDGARAPLLTIDYIVPVRPVIVRWGRVGDEFQMVFRGEAGNSYEIQSLDPSMSPAVWVTRTNHVVKLVSRDVEFREPLGSASARLYRVADVGDVD